MARKYRILNTEPHVFYAQMNTGWRSLWTWENLGPLNGSREHFLSEADARLRIERNIEWVREADEQRAKRKADLRGYPRVTPYR
jgi:hypothetical protein